MSIATPVANAGRLVVWDLESNTLKKFAADSAEEFKSIDFSPDGTKLYFILCENNNRPDCWFAIYTENAAGTCYEYDAA